MPENPLLPNAQLRALHSLLKTALPLSKPPRLGRSGSGAADPARTEALARREALLAGTLLQLCAGDILVPESGDPVPANLSRARLGNAEPGPSYLSLSPGSPQLTLAASLAEALQQNGSDRLVLALVRSGLAEPEWAKILARAEEGKFPLILVCADPSGADTFRQVPQTLPVKSSPLHWTSAQRLTSRAKLPVLSVDGEDAVAVYRVMQESVLRARSGGGPALIWAMLPTQAEAARQPRSTLPLARLERYLRTRQIAF